MKLRVDAYQTIVGTALLVDIPLMMGAMRLGHALKAPEHWFYTQLPGVGLGIIGLAGNAVVGSYRLKPEIDPELRAMLNSSWKLSFGCIIWVLTWYLMAVAHGVPIIQISRELLPALPATAHGLFLMSWFGALIGVPHINGPSLLAISGDEQAMEAKDKKADLEAAGAVASEKQLKLAKAPMKKRVLMLVQQEGPQTREQMLRALGSTSVTVGKYAAELVGDGVFAESGESPNVYRMASSQLETR